MLHFIVAGGILYGFAVFVRGPNLLPPDEFTIEVDRSSLLTFMQFRSNAFEQESFSNILTSLSKNDQKALIEEYIHEEVLYREAVALGLDESDYIIRQRMVEKMRFLLGDLSADEETIDAFKLDEYFEENKTAYWVPPSVTFTHVFFDETRRSPEQAKAMAVEQKQQLNLKQLGFNDAVEGGDHFVFLRNYVGRTLDFVANHFGTDFARQLVELSGDKAQWQGPLDSVYGQHVVLLTDYSPGRYPELSEVKDQVQEDYNAEQREVSLKEMINAVRDRYDIRINDSSTGHE